MTTTTTDRTPLRTDPPWAATAVIAGGIAATIGAAAYISSFVLLGDLSGRQAMSSPLCVTANIVMTIGFVTLALTLPTFGERARLPHWPVLAAAAACIFVAANAWAMGTEIADLAGSATDSAWEQGPGPLGLVSRIPKMVLSLIGFGGLAIVGWRRRAISRGACVVLILAALVSALLMPHQPGALLAGIGLAWAARSARSPR